MKLLKFNFLHYSVRLMYLSILLLIGYGSYCYSVPKFSIGSHEFINLFYREPRNLPVQFYYMQYFIFIFIILTILVYFLTVYYAFDKLRKERIRYRYIVSIFNYLLSILFMEKRITDAELKTKMSRIKKYIHTDYSKELLINSLQQIHHQTIGRSRQDSERIMQLLLRGNFIRSYLLSPTYRHKKIALEIISEFQIPGYDRYVLKLAKQSRNRVLHTDALSVLSRLDIRNNLLILSEINLKLSLWDVNVMLNNIKRETVNNIPYSTLLQSENWGILLLGIMLVRIHQLKEFKYEIQKRIDYPDTNVQEEAIFAIASFVEDIADFIFLKDLYVIATPKAKTVIINTMASCPDKKMAILFLEWVVVNEPVQFKVDALLPLLTLDSIRIAVLRRSEDPLVNSACKQVLDINI